MAFLNAEGMTFTVIALIAIVVLLLATASGVVALIVLGAVRLRRYDELESKIDRLGAILDAMNQDRHQSSRYVVADQDHS